MPGRGFPQGHAAGRRRTTSPVSKRTSGLASRASVVTMSRPSSPGSTGEVQGAPRAGRAEEHRLGRTVELDHARVPGAGENALQRRGNRPATEEERVDGEVAGRIEPARTRDLAEDDRLEGQPGEHLRAHPMRQLERPGKGNIPIDVTGGNRDAPALLGDQLDQMGGRRHEREAVQEDAARGEDVGVRGANGACRAGEVTGRQPRGVRDAGRPRGLAVVADGGERRRARAVDARSLQLGAGGERELTEIRRPAEAHARQALAVERARARPLDRRLQGGGQLVGRGERRERLQIERHGKPQACVGWTSRVKRPRASMGP